MVETIQANIQQQNTNPFDNDQEQSAVGGHNINPFDIDSDEEDLGQKMEELNLITHQDSTEDTGSSRRRPLLMSHSSRAMSLIDTNDVLSMHLLTCKKEDFPQGNLDFLRKMADKIVHSENKHSMYNDKGLYSEQDRPTNNLEALKIITEEEELIRSMQEPTM